AILVGIQTIIQDNPQLTTRLPRGGIHPIRVILDTHLRIPKDANVITDSTCDTLILTGRDADQDRIRKLNREHVSVVRFEENYLSITDVIPYLGEREIMSMLVEVGATV